MLHWIQTVVKRFDSAHSGTTGPKINKYRVQIERLIYHIQQTFWPNSDQIWWTPGQICFWVSHCHSVGKHPEFWKSLQPHVRLRYKAQNLDSQATGSRLSWKCFKCCRSDWKKTMQPLSITRYFLKSVVSSGGHDTWSASKTEQKFVNGSYILGIMNCHDTYQTAATLVTTTYSLNLNSHSIDALTFSNSRS